MSTPSADRQQPGECRAARRPHAFLEVPVDAPLADRLDRLRSLLGRAFAPGPSHGLEEILRRLDDAEAAAATKGPGEESAHVPP